MVLKGKFVRFKRRFSEHVYAGTVKEVVPAGKMPILMCLGAPGPRNYESYVVRVGSQNYWPENIEYL